jgi:hypothetical protein
MRIARACSRLALAHSTVIDVISKKGMSKTRLLEPAPLSLAGSLGQGNLPKRRKTILDDGAIDRREMH